MMGLPNWLHWVGWFSITLLISSSGLSLLNLMIHPQNSHGLISMAWDTFTSLMEAIILPLCVGCLGSRANSQHCRGPIDYTSDPGALRRSSISFESAWDWEVNQVIFQRLPPHYTECKPYWRSAVEWGDSISHTGLGLSVKPEFMQINNRLLNLREFTISTLLLRAI